MGRNTSHAKENGAFQGARPHFLGTSFFVLAHSVFTETFGLCLCFSRFVCGQDVAVMGSPRLTEMNKGLRRLTRIRNDPLFSPFNVQELGGSLTGVRSQNGEKPKRQQQQQHEDPAPLQLYRPDAYRL